MTDVDIFLEHYGVKGQKWGVRKPSGTEVRAARKEIAAIGKTARQINKASRKAKTRQEAKAASDAYRKEVYDKLRDPSFKSTYDKANSLTKGDIMVQIALTGPLAAITIPAIKSQQQTARDFGPGMERSASSTQLAKLRANEKTKPNV